MPNQLVHSAISDRRASDSEPKRKSQLARSTASVPLGPAAPERREQISSTSSGVTQMGIGVGTLGYGSKAPWGSLRRTGSRRAGCFSCKTCQTGRPDLEQRSSGCLTPPPDWSVRVRTAERRRPDKTRALKARAMESSVGGWTRRRLTGECFAFCVIDKGLVVTLFP